MPDPIEDVIATIRDGRPVVITDDQYRENEGDLVAAAETITPELVNFMASEARGLICVPLTEPQAELLDLPLMAQTRDRFNTAFTVSVDAARGISTGISAADRARTIGLLADPTSTAEDFDRPGHIFPLVAREGGVLMRPGHTEAAVDLARLAGREPAGVICEIMNPDGSMARNPELRDFCNRHSLKWGTISDLIRYRQKRESLIEKSGAVRMPSEYAAEAFMLHAYTTRTDGKEQVAMVYGDVRGADHVLVRVHSECLTGDVFHSARCDCGEQLDLAMRKIVAEGRGVLIYLRQEGRGIGLIAKINAYALQDRGLDTVDANIRLGYPDDLRDYSVAAHILEDLEVGSVRLLTNNPRKIEGLQQFGVEVHERVPIVIASREQNEQYLRTKKTRMGHML